MAVINPTIYAGGHDLSAGNRVPRGTVIVVWVLDAGDTGAPFRIPTHGDKTVQNTSGSYGTSTFTFQGSNDPVTVTNYFTLADPQGNAISKTANALEAILENTVWVRPAYSAGTGTTLTATLVCETSARG